MGKLNQIDEKTALTEVHHLVCSAAEAFSRLSANIPRVSLEIVQHIYGRFDEALCCIYEAENTYDLSIKADRLNKAKSNIFFQFTSLELLVSNHSITVGQANGVIELLKESHTDICKWLKSVINSNNKH